MKTSILKPFMFVVALLFISSPLFATNGYFAHGYGSMNKGTAGAGIAVFRSALNVATNPATMAFLNKSFEINVATFVPIRQFTVEGQPSGFDGTFGLAPGTVESDNKLFVIPSVAANLPIGEGQAIALALYGNGGMNTTYNQPIFGGSEPVGVDLSQMFFSTTYARAFGDNHSIGLSAILAYQRFEARGLEMFGAMGMSMDGNSLTNNGHDNSFGYGFRVGYYGALTPALQVGASYQTKMFMSEFEDYAGLFAEHGDFDIPSNWTVGMAYAVNDWTLLLDVQKIYYSNVNSVGNPISPQALPPAFPDGNGGFIPNTNQVPLGDNQSSGFGWEDMTTYKMGAEFAGIDTWTLRGGFSYGNQPVPESEVLFNILAPGVIQKHATIGFSKWLDDKHAINFAAMHGFKETVRGPNPFEIPGQQTIELEMYQWELELGFTF